MTGIKIESSDQSPFWELIKRSRPSPNYENQRIKNAQFQFDLWPVKKWSDQELLKRWSSDQAHFLPIKNLDPGRKCFNRRHTSVQMFEQATYKCLLLWNRDHWSTSSLYVEIPLVLFSGVSPDFALTRVEFSLAFSLLPSFFIFVVTLCNWPTAPVFYHLHYAKTLRFCILQSKTGAREGLGTMLVSSRSIGCL